MKARGLKLARTSGSACKRLIRLPNFNDSSWRQPQLLQDRSSDTSNKAAGISGDTYLVVRDISGFIAGPLASKINRSIRQEKIAKNQVRQHYYHYDGFIYQLNTKSPPPHLRNISGLAVLVPGVTVSLVLASESPRQLSNVKKTSKIVRELNIIDGLLCLINTDNFGTPPLTHHQGIIYILRKHHRIVTGNPLSVSNLWISWITWKIGESKNQ